MSTLVNTELAKLTMQKLRSWGVEEVCLCPGSRNAPLIAVLLANPDLFKIYYFFEERSAGFFALGRMKVHGKPVAVLTTSGTAAGELLPAMMEAYYSGFPLVALTADRPRHYRGTGAPQTAEQVGIFGVYAPRGFDWAEVSEAQFEGVTQSAPIHVNVCFDEPLLEKVTDVKARNEIYRVSAAPALEETPLEFRGEWGEFFNRVKNPVILVGMVPQEFQSSVKKLLLDWQVPAYFEGISGLREDADLAGLRVHCGDSFVQSARVSGYPVDGLIRIGGVPTLRVWRDLEGSLSQLPVLSLSHVPFSGLGRESRFVSGNLERIFADLPRSFSEKSSISQFLEFDQRRAEKIEELLRKEPTSEPGLVHALSEWIPSESKVFLGNSLPIREWDLAASRSDHQFQVWASRGLNGIDGQVSTFLGFAEKGKKNWAILGDLTTLYDLPGPWILPQLDGLHAEIVVINNGGGKIFSQLYPYEEFQNQHETEFRAWAELWKMDYVKCSRVSDLKPSDRSRVIEIVPDAEATVRFWAEYRKL